MIILLVDALLCGMIVGRLPTENPEPLLRKVVGKEEKSCYGHPAGRECP